MSDLKPLCDGCTQFCDGLCEAHAAKERIKQLENALRKQSTLLDAVSPSGREGIYIKHMDYDDWLDRCDKSNAVVNELLSTGDT